MASKTIIDRVRREWALRGTLEEFHKLTVEGLCERFAPMVEDGEDLGEAVDLLLRVLERCLDARESDLDDADGHHVNLKKRLGRLRERRGEAADELRRTLVDIRHTLTSFYGRKTSNRLLHIQGPTPKAHDPINLLGQAHSAFVGLRSAEEEPPKRQSQGVRVPFQEWRRAWIESLESGHARLEEICNRIENETIRGQSTQRGKDLAADLHDRDLSAISNLQEALLILGMQPDLGRLVWKRQRPEGRPRRRGTKKQPPKASESLETGARKEEATDSEAFQQVSSTEVG